jgi:hypothetical protein
MEYPSRWEDENKPNSEALRSRREFLFLASAALFVSSQVDTVTLPSNKSPSSLLTLNYRKSFLVTSSIERGRIGFVELESQAGGECRM